jgi:parvulin-like peptidyl-prolyl isomerase
MRFFTLLIGILFAHQAFAQNLAVVGGTPITLQEFQKKYDEIKRQAINPPSPELFLEDLVRYELGVQEANKRGLKNDPIVQERFKQELYKALIEKELGKKVDGIKVNESEMKAHYRKNPELRSSHILIEFKPDANEEQIATARKRAEEILKEVRASKRPFEELVRLYSDDNLSKRNGGDIGFQSRMTVVPTYYDSLSKLKKGEIGGPIRTLYGFHIVKLTDIRPYENANKKQIRAAVFDEKRKVLFDTYFKNLKNRYTVEKNDALLKQVK